MAKTSLLGMKCINYASAIPLGLSHVVVELWCLAEHHLCDTKAITSVGYVYRELVQEGEILQTPNNVDEYLREYLLQHQLKTFNLLQYRYGFHWVLLVIQTDLSKVIIWDSQETKLDKIYPEYCKRGGRNLPLRKQWKIVDDFKCRKHNKGKTYCGYYGWDFMHIFTNDIRVIDSEQLDMAEDSFTEYEFRLGFHHATRLPENEAYHCFNHHLAKCQGPSLPR
ncbi:hypothetical protein ACP70R_001878 [Stipagrostis hirtigluma subsp. patula]